MSTQSLSVMDTRYGFTPEQVDVIKATIAPGATNEELALFLMVCQKTGLDPFSRQIYLSERRTKDPNTGGWTVKKTPETTIDGFRVIAERSNEYEGQDGPYWCGSDGKWVDVWLDLKAMPSAAKVGIWRKGFKTPVWGVALFEEYKQTKTNGELNYMWSKMGANQLAKCAEALALRKAFPRDLSNMYSREEMGQAENNAKEAQQDVAQRRIRELSAPKEGAILRPVADNVIIELADSLDQTPEPPLMDPDVKKPPKPSAYEMREAAKREEAEQALKSVGTPKETRKRGTISFKALAAYKEVKEQLRLLVGDDHVYYDILKLSNVSHADELAAEQSKDVYKLMANTVIKMRNDKALRDDLATHNERLGYDRYISVLGANGFENTDMLLTEATGPQVQAVLDDLKAAV